MTVGQKKALYLHLFYLIVDNPDVSPEAWRSKVVVDPMYKRWITSCVPVIYKYVIRCLDTHISIEQENGTEMVFHRRFIEQNKSKPSAPAIRARNGARIVHVYDSKWLDKIEDGVIASFAGKS